MTLVQWKPRSLSRSEGFEPFLSRFFDLMGDGMVSGTGWSPALEVFEEDDRLIASLDLPGVDPKNVEINLQGDILTVRGERKDTREEHRGSVLRKEQAYGSFERTVQLPYRVETDKVKASYTHGVLRIEMPKTQEVLGRRITVDVK